MKLAILGGGAVGLALAASLTIRRTGKVTLLLRGSNASALRKSGLVVDMPDGRQVILAPDDLDPVDLSELGRTGLDCDFLFVATKAYQLADALRSLFSIAGDRCRPRAIILLQNGWGSADEARSVIPPGIPVYSGVVLAGLSRVEVNHVRFNGVAAPLEIGSLFADSPDSLDSLVENTPGSLLPLARTGDIRSRILRKLLLNTTLNATCTLTGLTYGELLTVDVARPLAVSVAGETLDVIASSFGFREFPSGEAFVEDYLRPLVVPKAASHRPSMAQDIDNGRETEIDYLNGAIVGLAHAWGMQAPVNQNLTSLIRARSRKPS